MGIRRLYNRLVKPYDLERRCRAAFEQGELMCEACGKTTALADHEALTIFTCPACGFKVFVPALLNRYFLYEPLGAGGMSSVYKAVREKEARRFYAVKLLRSDRAVDEQELHDFLFEAGVHAKVSPHPHIVTFIEQGEAGHEYYHVMDFVPGESVRLRVERTGRIPEKTALTWMAQTVSALEHILEKGYLYRDISPGNLLIRADQSVCLIDFGLALSVDDADRAEVKQSVVGTPEYLPPERIQQQGEDERSSIYSLGLLLFFMLKGEPLIKGASHLKAALQHVAALRVAFNERMLPTDISPEAVLLLSQMIKFDPVDRIPTLHVLQQALTSLLKKT